MRNFSLLKKLILEYFSLFNCFYNDYIFIKTHIFHCFKLLVNFCERNSKM